MFRLFNSNSIIVYFYKELIRIHFKKKLCTKQLLGYRVDLKRKSGFSQGLFTIMPFRVLPNMHLVEKIMNGVSFYTSFPLRRRSCSEEARHSLHSLCSLARNFRVNSQSYMFHIFTVSWFPCWC